MVTGADTKKIKKIFEKIYSRGSEWSNIPILKAKIWFCFAFDGTYYFEKSSHIFDGHRDRCDQFLARASIK